MCVEKFLFSDSESFPKFRTDEDPLFFVSTPPHVPPFPLVVERAKKEQTWVKKTRKFLKLNIVFAEISWSTSSESTWKSKPKIVRKRPRPLAMGFDRSIDSAGSRGRKKDAETKTKNVMYDCELCGKKCSHGAKYERHLNLHSRKKKSRPVCFECGTCRQSAARKSALESHKLKHSNERPHECEVCAKTFKRSWQVTTRGKIHRGSGHNLEVCGFSTAYKVSLKTHKCSAHQRNYRTSVKYARKHLCRVTNSRTYLLWNKRVIDGVKSRAPNGLKCSECDETFASEIAWISTRKSCCVASAVKSSRASIPSSSMVESTRGNVLTVATLAWNHFHVRTLWLSTNSLASALDLVSDLCDKSFTQRTTMMAHRRKHPGSHPPLPATSLSKYENA